MNEATIKAIRKLGMTPDTDKSQEYGLYDAKGLLIMGWISEERAQEYQIYYKGSKIQKMNIGHIK